MDNIAIKPQWAAKCDSDEEKLPRKMHNTNANSCMNYVCESQRKRDEHFNFHKAFMIVEVWDYQ